MSRFHRLIALSLMGALMSACVAPLPDRTPAPTLRVTQSSGTIITQDNVGMICFTRYDVANQTLSGVTYPHGCFSSNCHLMAEKHVNISLDPGSAAMRFTNHFEIRDLTVVGGTPQICLTICSSPGEAVFTMTGVLVGARYDVFLGERRLGEITLPSNPASGDLKTCVGP